MNNNKLQIIGVNAYLENINYHSKEISYQESQVQITQNLSVISCTQEKIIIRMERSLKTENNKSAFLSISAIGEFYLDPTSKNNFKSITEMNEYANKRAKFLVNKIQLGSFLSQLIANITGIFGNTPVILPPIINSENQEIQ